MISTKRITQLVKKWHRMAALKKRLSWRTTKEVDECCTSVASTAHCVVYSADGKRFEVPLEHLSTVVIAQLLQISLEEFGFMSDGPIMEYAMCLLGRRASAQVQKAFLSTMAVPCHYGNCGAPSVGVSQQIAVCSS